MQKYRADRAEPNQDGSISWFAIWQGGPSLAKVENCRLDLEGDMRRTVYVTGEPGSFFSTPAVCRISGCKIVGFLTSDGDGLIFRAGYYA